MSTTAAALCVLCHVYNFFIILLLIITIPLSPAKHILHNTHNLWNQKLFHNTGKFEMQVLLRRESRKGGVILKNRCRFFFDGKKTRFSKMQMALGGEQAGTCFSFVSYVSRFRT